ncbi:rare lipoprotein A [Amycolatopsis mediterranei S699]|uniref:Rare lipoprotein A n=2 Tax=Amycolatopsis mediterranei TaxID=33910 RepID=A0A0H3D885_AMYMU|nr:expansin EXLX1 family cellulose-binding protein [Amycolatopsis mediterranei]ADJ45744.1 rare lipoprotein A [Amycolatopsis mediterranei U32]AEK42525.1 rare lipoprotein A [Amycolatopsis mediterranei S699]AFO77456.1 rare lipoprotein A [Amycolatopsis mediterranei S699]AGT84584.1 rare lipoprotein A [Amycolatopsis mediterranei RB]KDO05280.1 lipoprotein [Amycolatopsis mediterranei]
MPKRAVIVSLVALLVVATAVVVLVVTRAAGPAPAEAANRADAAPVIGTAVTTPPVSTSPPSPSATTTTPASSSVTAPTSAAGSADAPLAGRIKPGASHSGVATFYDTDGTGACGYDASPDPLNAAMNVADFEGSQACGAYVEVHAAGGASVTVRITNLCPAPCRVGQLDLNPKAFDRLGARVRGEIPVTWKLVSQPSAKQISLRYKEGSSQYWCGIQVLDHRNPVARLEVRAGSSWKRLQRTDYNYFLSENGAGCGGAVAVTDIYGERLVIDALPVKAGVSQPANRQFAQH